MQEDPAQRAISAALSGNWKEASLINLQILKDSPKDVDAMNRLARAYAETGNLKKAKVVSEKVLKIEPENQIALKCLTKWKGLKKTDGELSTAISCQDAFLEEPGKTRLVNLLHVGAGDVLAQLDSGDEVKLVPHAHRVNCVNLNGSYIGRLPDDLSARLRSLISGGNTYRVLVKSTQRDGVKIFVREMEKGKGMEKVQSFPPERIDYIAFTPPELVHKKEEVPISIEE